MDTLTITGIPPLDGSYEFDLGELIASLTNRDLHRIKVMSGVRAGELEDALKAGDNDVVIALVAILLQRRGKRVDENHLWDAPAGSGISLDLAEPDEAEGEVNGDVPPAVAAETPPTD